MSRFWHWEYCVRWAVLFQFSFAWFLVLGFQVPYNLYGAGINLALGVLFGTWRHWEVWSTPADTE